MFEKGGNSIFHDNGDMELKVHSKLPKDIEQMWPCACHLAHTRRQATQTKKNG